VERLLLNLEVFSSGKLAPPARRSMFVLSAISLTLFDVIVLLSCQLCPLAFCEDCLPPGDLESVGDVLPEFLLLGYGRKAQAHFIRCTLCLEHFAENPEVAAAWKKDQDKIEAKAKKLGYDF